MMQNKNAPLTEQMSRHAIKLGLDKNITYDQVRDWLYDTHGWFINIEDKRKIHPLTNSLQENSGFIVHVTNKNGVVVVGSGGTHHDHPDKALIMAVEQSLLSLIIKNE